MSTIDDIGKLFKRLREQRSIGATISEMGPRLEERARELVEKKQQTTEAAIPEPAVEQPKLEKLEDGVYQDEQGSLFSVERGKVLPFQREEESVTLDTWKQYDASHKEKRASLNKLWKQARDNEDIQLMDEIRQRMDTLQDEFQSNFEKMIAPSQDAALEEFETSIRLRDAARRRASMHVVKEGEEPLPELREPTDEELLHIQEEEIEMNQPENIALYDFDVVREGPVEPLPVVTDFDRKSQDLLDRFLNKEITEEEFNIEFDRLLQEGKDSGQPTLPQEPQARGELVPFTSEDYRAKDAGIQLSPNQRLNKLNDGFHEDLTGKMFLVKGFRFVKTLSDDEAKQVRTELAGHPLTASLNLPLNAPGARTGDDTTVPNTTPQVDPTDARIEELMRRQQEKYGPGNPDLEKELVSIRKMNAEAREMRERMLNRGKVEPKPKPSAKPEKEKKSREKKVVESAKVKRDTRTEKEKDARFDELKSISIAADIPMDANFLRRLSDFDLQETFQRVYRTDFNKLNIPEPSEEEQIFLITPILREMERRGFIK